jgi:hypothetical protein
MMDVGCGVCCGVSVGPENIVKMRILRFKQIMLVPFDAIFQDVQKFTFWQDVHFCTS